MICEIVHVQVGQCTNFIENGVWSTMIVEHKLEKDGKFAANVDGADNQGRLDKIVVCFKQAGELRFVPYAALVDSEPGGLDDATMVKSGNFVFGASGAGNNLRKAQYNEVVDVIRKDDEQCDCPQGFQIRHSCDGGTGSRFANLLLIKMRYNYPNRITATFSASDVVVEPCKGRVSSNEALYNISHNILQQQTKYAGLNCNWVISLVMGSGIGESLRFSGNYKLNTDLRKLCTNVVSFARLHFFTIPVASRFSPGDPEHVKVTVQEITDQM